MTVPVETAAARDNAASLRYLVTRFERRRFAVTYLNRERGELVVTYVGGLGPYVVCGDWAGVNNPSPTAAVGNGPDRVSSRMVVRLGDGTGGPTSPSVDAVHVVSLARPVSATLNKVDVRLGQPARTGDGRYCWSTGEMERLAQLRP